MGKPSEDDTSDTNGYGNPGYNDLNDDTYPGGTELEKDEKVCWEVRCSYYYNYTVEAEKRARQDRA